MYYRPIQLCFHYQIHHDKPLFKCLSLLTNIEPFLFLFFLFTCSFYVPSIKFNSSFQIVLKLLLFVFLNLLGFSKIYFLSFSIASTIFCLIFFNWKNIVFLIILLFSSSNFCFFFFLIVDHPLKIAIYAFYQFRSPSKFRITSYFNLLNA